MVYWLVKDKVRTIKTIWQKVFTVGLLALFLANANQAKASTGNTSESTAVQRLASMAPDEPGLVPFANYVPYDSTQVIRKDPNAIFVKFEFDKTAINPELFDNQEKLDAIMQSVSRVVGDSLLEVKRIQIVGMASIEGAAAYNYKIGMQRAEALRNYIMQHEPTLTADLFELNSAGEAWVELRSKIEEVTFNGKQQVLEIIDKTKNPWLREQRLKQLQEGQVYKYLMSNLFAEQRNAAYMRIYYEQLPMPEPEVEEPEPEVEPQPEPEVVEEVTPELPTGRELLFDDGPFWLAVKTNMLFDAALTPNIEVERWLGKHHRFSLMAEVWFPWYVWRHNSNAYEVLTIGLEGRYWLLPYWKRPNRPITGLFVGAYAAGGKYDIERKSKGDQGEFTSLGLSIGYTWRIGRNLNLELSASGGWVSGPYRHYEGKFNDTHLIWQRNEHFSYFGPTKLKFSLVWLLPERRQR